MKLSEVPDDKNFCRVFELPERFPPGYCFGGGLPVTCMLVDWFQPIPSRFFLDKPNETIPETWEELVPMLKKFLNDKVYLKPGRRYVLVTDFGEAFVFEK